MTARGVPSPSGLRRVATGLLLASIGAATAGPANAQTPATAPDRVASQALVVLTRGHVARTAPDAAAPRIASIGGRRPLSGVRTTLPVLERAVGVDGAQWLEVRLPGRPRRRTGWISALHTRTTSTPWRLTLDLSTRRLTVRQYGRVVRAYTAVVGKPSTPTPVGRFFIEETLALSPRAAGGPFALATSARSNVLQEFAGGPGQIAIHGTSNIGGLPGTAVSHGCVRLSGVAITWLARHIDRGTSLQIRR